MKKPGRPIKKDTLRYKYDNHPNPNKIALATVYKRMRSGMSFNEALNTPHFVNRPNLNTPERIKERKYYRDKYYKKYKEHPNSKYIRFSSLVKKLKEGTGFEEAISIASHPNLRSTFKIGSGLCDFDGLYTWMK